MLIKFRELFLLRRVKSVVANSVFFIIVILSMDPVLAGYSYSADGSEVTDSSTGLTWRRCAEGKIWSASTCTGSAIKYTHEQALNRAKTESASSGKAWRVPNVKELHSLIKLSDTTKPLIDLTAFPTMPLYNTTSSSFWTSTPVVRFVDRGFVVNFYYGGVGDTYRSVSNYVLLVR